MGLSTVFPGGGAAMWMGRAVPLNIVSLITALSTFRFSGRGGCTIADYNNDRIRKLLPTAS